MLSLEFAILAAAVLLLVSILASKASGKFGIPALLLFLVIGMLAGSDGIGGFYFDDPRLAQALGVVALVLILFAGGMDTDWDIVRPVLGPALALATVGVLLTTLLIGWFATWLLGFSLLEGLLLGAIVSSTDAAAVFAVLRSRNTSVKGQLKPLLELESGSNDPMAVFLTVAFILLLTAPNVTALDLIPLFVRQFLLGAVLGVGLGKATVWSINHLKLEFEGLYPVFTFATVLLIYAITALLQGSGFLAVYLAGLVIGNSDIIHKRSLLRFHDGLAWLMQIAMFLTLGLLVFPSRLAPVTGVGLVLALFLMFVARPISVFLTLALSKMEIRDKAMVAWVGLRGAVPIILATFPLLAGVGRAEYIFNLVFFIVFASVLLQGTTLPSVAQLLGVAEPLSGPVHYPQEFVPSVNATSKLIQVQLPPSSPAAGKSIVELGLPRGALFVSVGRNGDDLVPNGGTVLQAGDRITLLVNQQALEDVHLRLGDISPT